MEAKRITILIKRSIEYIGDRCGSRCKQRQAYRDNCDALQFWCDAFYVKLERWIGKDSEGREFIAVYRCPECKQHVERQVK